jgi:hypothetical protein
MATKLRISAALVANSLALPGTPKMEGEKKSRAGASAAV